MKGMLILLIIVLAVLAGCTAPSGTATATPTPTPYPVSGSIPLLTGTWTGPMRGVDEGTGFSDYPNLTMEMHVTEQHGRIFAGDMLFTSPSGKETVNITGVISRDGKTFLLSESGSGYSRGEMLSENEMELDYVDNNPPASAAIDTLKRL